MREFNSLDEFWPFYVSQHLRKGTRRLHFAGTTAGLLCLLAALVQRDLRFIAAGFSCAYGLAWTGHFFIERNKPATFEYPRLSFQADFRMYALMWRGAMEAEISRLMDRIRPYVKTGF